MRALPPIRTYPGVAATLALTVAALLWAYVLVRGGRVATARRQISRWARACLWLLGIRLEVQGLERIAPPGQGFITVANHVSALDVLIYTAILPADTRYVAKRELQRLPLFGPAFERAGNLFVDRGGTPETRARFNAALNAEPHRPLLLFPEGTRSRDGRLQPLRRGVVHIAMATRLPILPMVSRGAFELLPRHRWLPRPGRVEVRVGRLLATEDWSNASMDEHLEAIRQALDGVGPRGVPRQDSR